MEEYSDFLLFDADSYQDIPDQLHALSYVRFFSKNVDSYRGQLIAEGMDPDEIEQKIDTLWKRVLQGCYKFRVPLTPEATLAEKRLGI